MASKLSCKLLAFQIKYESLEVESRDKKGRFKS